MEFNNMIKFGTGGWREVIGENFNRHNVEKIAQSLASVMKTKRIVVGYDYRFLSENAAKWVAMVMAGNGISVILASSASPTPAVMLYTRKQKLEYGIAITASHNPYNFNGIKIFTEGGKDASAEFTKLLERLINKNLIIKRSEYDIALKKKMILIKDVNEFYSNNLPKIINLKEIANSKLKILVDPMNGVSKLLLDPILNKTNFKLNYINSDRDVFFGGRVPAPTSSNLIELKNKVLKHKFDLGIALDGDGDRIGIYDDRGNYLDANRLLSLLYYYFLEYEKKSGNIVRNLCTTSIVDKIASTYNQKAIETKVGFKYISAAMEFNQGLLGGESSGGIAMKGHIEGKDSIFATLLIIQMLTKTNKKISQLISEVETKFGRSLIIEKSYRFTETKKASIIKQIIVNKNIPPLNSKVNKITYIDGLKIVMINDSWVSLRFSGTEPLLRLIIEAKNKNEANQLITLFETYYKL
jgi:phosphomannomutase